MDSLSPEHSYENVEGLDGIAHIDTNYGGRNIHTSFYIAADDYDDFTDKRDAVYKLFRAKDTVTLIDNSQPHKQWQVQSEVGFTIDNSLSPNNDIFDITFISKSPYAHSDETVIATKDTTKKDYYFYSPIQVASYEQIENNKFIIYNAGDITLDPRQHPMVISFTGSSDKLRLRNNMNQSQWQYKGSTTVSDVLKVDMVYPYKNDNNIFEDTDYGAIVLNEGSNEIQVYGATGDYEIKFEYKPMYI